VDEAQHLNPDLLEELRLLGNLESRQGKAVQVVLAAQLGLLDTLERPELACLRQRLTVRVRLAPLGLDEAADYLIHHLRRAGGRPERIVTDEALEVLARGAGGVPRQLNQAMHQALQLAHSAGAAQVDAEAAVEALALLGLLTEKTETEGDSQKNESAEETPSGPMHRPQGGNDKDSNHLGNLFAVLPRSAG
jgi:type II secretory pathway predicted ATPase ExeA